MFSTFTGGVVIGLAVGAVGMFLVYGNNKGKFNKLYSQTREEIDQVKAKANLELERLKQKLEAAEKKILQYRILVRPLVTVCPEKAAPSTLLAEYSHGILSRLTVQ